MWSADSSPQVVVFFQRMRQDYEELMANPNSNYVSWSSYFRNNQACRADYPLLEGFSNSSILAKYRSLMT
jgi:hypothetical protein